MIALIKARVTPLRVILAIIAVLALIAVLAFWSTNSARADEVAPEDTTAAEVQSTDPAEATPDTSAQDAPVVSESAVEAVVEPVAEPEPVAEAPAPEAAAPAPVAEVAPDTSAQDTTVVPQTVVEELTTPSENFVLSVNVNASCTQITAFADTANADGVTYNVYDPNNVLIAEGIPVQAGVVQEVAPVGPQGFYAVSAINSEGVSVASGEYNVQCNPQPPAANVEITFVCPTAPLTVPNNLPVKFDYNVENSEGETVEIFFAGNKIDELTLAGSGTFEETYGVNGPVTGQITVVWGKEVFEGCTVTVPGIVVPPPFTEYRYETITSCDEGLAVDITYAVEITPTLVDGEIVNVEGRPNIVNQVEREATEAECPTAPPVDPEEPVIPGTPVTPVVPATPDVPAASADVTPVSSEKTLPPTGTTVPYGLIAGGTFVLLSGAVVIIMARRRRNADASQ